MEHKNLYSTVICIFFCCLAGGGCLLSLLWPRKTFSPSENRYLAERPDFSWDTFLDGTFGRRYETWLSDQFPFRDQWIGIKTRAEQAVLRDEINHVFIGKDDYLMNALYPEDLDTELYHRNLDRLRTFSGYACELLGEEHVRLMLAPSASQVLPDRLPPFASPFDQSVVYEDLAALLPENGSTLMVPVLDALLQAPALSLSDQEMPLEAYYRTDHHWTSYGAYTAYRAWAESLGITPLKTGDFSIRTADTDFLGTVSSRLNIPVKPDSIHLFLPLEEQDYEVSYDGSKETFSSLYTPEALDTRDKYRVFLDGNHGWTKIINHSLPQDRKLLIIKDSYAHSFAPFASLHFGQVHMIDLRYYNGKVSDFMEQQGITDVLVLYQIPGFLEDVNLGKLVRF